MPAIIFHCWGNIFCRVDASAIDNEPDIVIASSTTVNVQSPFTDLAISFTRIPIHVALNGSQAGRATATIKLVNDGNVTAHGAVTLNLYLSADAVLDASDPLLATRIARPITLREGGAKSFTFRIAVPPGTPIGGYFLFATVIPVSGIVDSNPINNVTISANRIAVVQQLPKKHENNLNQADQTDDGALYSGPSSCGFGYGVVVAIQSDDSSDSNSPDNGPTTPSDQASDSNTTSQPSSPTTDPSSGDSDSSNIDDSSDNSSDSDSTDDSDNGN